MEQRCDDGCHEGRVAEKGRNLNQRNAYGVVDSHTTLNVYTHVVDASHGSAVEAVEDRLFVDLVSNGLESAKALEQAVPVSAVLTRL
jgi:hypothetical protein